MSENLLELFSVGLYAGQQFTSILTLKLGGLACTRMSLYESKNGNYKNIDNTDYFSNWDKDRRVSNVITIFNFLKLSTRSEAK